MTQQNVLNTLKKEDRWMTSQEIAAIIKVNPGNVTVSLKKLYKYGEVLRKVIGKKSGYFRFRDSKPFYWRAK